MNCYSIQIWAKAPDGETVAYRLRIETEAFIAAEELAEFCDSVGPGYQEDIADRLLARFGGQQILESDDYHAGRVQITTERGQYK